MTDEKDIIGVEDLCSRSPAFWAGHHKVQVTGGDIFSFEGREYLIEPMNSMAQRQCFMKGTQGGASLVVMLKILWGQIYGKYPKGALYLMPSRDDVQEFSKSRFNPLILNNKKAIGQYIKNVKGGKTTDTASLKDVCGSFLYLRSGTLPKKIDVGYSESGGLKSITVDIVAFDEIDIMDSDIRVKACGRMSASKVKAEIYIGNPGVPDMGIDEIFQESDKRHWWMRCGSCGVETCAEFEFFDNPGFIKQEDDNTSYIGCKQCGKQIHVKDGRWVPDAPDNTGYMSGWRWSRLMLPDCMPHEVLRDYNNPPQGNLGDVLRTQLAMPYIPSEDAITKSQVFSCCGTSPQLSHHGGPCAMGVDVGDTKHVVIGGRTGDDTWEIFRVARVRRWQEIHDLAKRFNVKSAVIDLNPMRDKAREFQASERYRIFLCEYSESTPLGVSYNKNTGLVKVQRTEIFDQTGAMIQGNKVTLPRKSPEIVEFANQVTEPKCIEEKDKRTNALVRRYRGREDHYRNALNYFRLAADGGKVGLARNSEFRHDRQAYAICERRGYG